MTEQPTIHLAFGPVQESVAQARRTRDLWAGSYLLSFLAASALKAAQDARGSIVLPALADNPLWLAVSRGWETLTPEQQALAKRVGSVPHIAELTAPNEEQAEAVARAAVAGWNTAWEKVAKEVREYLGHKVLPRWDSATDAIWNRQIAEAWTVTWSVTTEREAAGRRKSLRSFALQPEPGETCTCCGRRQPLHTGADDKRAAVRACWEEAGKRAGHVEIREKGSERLCAVCAVKRFYPHVAREALGWEVASAFPSTTAFAGYAWRQAVLETGAANGDLRGAVATAVAALRQAGATTTSASAFAGLERAADRWGPDRDAAMAFLRYEGDWFDPDGVQNGREAAGQFAGPQHEATRRTLAGSARALRRAARAAGIDPPGTDYALLVMDGDRMGALLRDHSDRTEQISQALGTFSAGVREIVEETHHGRLIYAGGDDVLAMLPKESALKAAQALRDKYEQAFRERAPFTLVADSATRPTISAGLLFAHEQTPLRSVIHEGHTLLDEVAKQRGGRDATAISVRQRGGATLTFAAKWGEPAITTIEEVAKNARNGDYSRGFLYDLRQLLPVAAALPDAQARTDLLAADFMQGERRKRDGVAIERARERVQALLDLKPAEHTGDRWDVIRLVLWLAGPRKGDR